MNLAKLLCVWAGSLVLGASAIALCRMLQQQLESHTGQQSATPPEAPALPRMLLLRRYEPSLN
jgi:hypothetical protein